MPGRRVHFDFYGIGLDAICYAIVFFLLFPIAIVVLTSFTSASFISFPPKPPLTLEWYLAFLQEPRWILAFKNSIIVGTMTMIVSLTIGVTASLGLAKKYFKGSDAIYFLVLLPVFTPGIVLGISLLMAFGLLGLQGTYLSLVAAHTLWSAPLVLIIISAVLLKLDSNLLDAAMVLGATPVRSFFEITLPLIKAGILSSAFLAFVTSFHEFVMALFLSSPATRTLPVVIWTSLRFELRPIIAAIDTIMIVLVILVLIAIAKSVGIEKFKIGV